MGPKVSQMRNQMIARAAVASMLFGGTLSAQAGVVAFGGNTNPYSWCRFEVIGAYDGDLGYSPLLAGSSGAIVDGAVSFSDATYGSASATAFSSSGFSITTNFSSASLADGNNPQITFRQAFTASEAVTMNWTGSPTYYGWLRIDLLGGPGVPPVTYWQMDGSNSALNLQATQAGEYYLLSFTSYGPVIQSGTVLNVSFAAVPAPGAAVLVGLAGLMSRRRRN